MGIYKYHQDLELDINTDVTIMGNFSQHKQWSLYTIVLIQSVIIYLIIQQTFPINFLSFDSAKGQLALFFVLLSIPIIFTIGAVSPDIDLPKDSFQTKMFFRFFLPLLFGFGIGIGFYKIIVSDVFIHGFSSVGLITDEMKNMTSLPFIVAISFGILVALLSFVAVWYIDQKSKHWGFCHSIIFSIILSSVVFIALMGIWGAQYYQLVILQTLAYLLGYWNHLTCDQVYHEIRDKHWNDKRYALKLWSNDWRFDPFIVLAELTSEDGKPHKSKRKKHDHISH